MRNRDLLGRDTLRGRAARSGQIWEQRQQARQDVVDSYETIDDPNDVGLSRNGGGIGPSQGFLEFAEPREMAHRIDQEVDVYDVQTRDVHETNDGWGLTSGAERRVAAAEFERDTELEEVHPEDDIRRVDDGFELRDSVFY